MYLWAYVRIVYLLALRTAYGVCVGGGGRCVCQCVECVELKSSEGLATVHKTCI